MNSSWKIGRPAGIDLQIHVTFPLALLWAFWRGWQSGGTGAGVAQGLLVLALFGCVALHELGHSLVARRFGIGTRQIVLYPIGGVASLERAPSRPLEELLMALGGPMVNVLIAGLLSLLAGGWPRMSELNGPATSFHTWFALLIVSNIALAVFNLIPAFPMDGGRIFRSFLALFLPYATATRIASALGVFLAIGMGLFGLYIGHLFLVGISVFIALAARRENSAVQVRARLDGSTVEQIMRKDPPVLAPEDLLAACRDRCAAQGRTDFGVLHEGRLVGLLPDPVWRTALQQLGPETPVYRVMETRFPALAPQTPLSRLAGAAGGRTSLFPVIADGVLLGFLTQGDLARQIVSARSRPHRAAGWRIDLG
ncbi:MAG: site-2 protease family protein [Kiritimatiellia bacterium]|nr:site-2 protease family protein [Kiritimatiellia bacterium]